MNRQLVFLVLFSLIGVLFFSSYDLSIEQGSKFPSKYGNMPFTAKEGQRVRVEIQKHPIYGNSIELYLLDEKDSVSTVARFSMDSVFQSVDHYVFLDGGRTMVNVSHQKSNVYNSITYERRDREGYVIEGAQIQIILG